MSVVDLFFDNDFFIFLCDQTNLYARQVITVVPQPFTKYSTFLSYTPATVLEMKKFLSLKFVTGIIKKPDLKLYWTKDIVFSTPIFSNQETDF